MLIRKMRRVTRIVDIFPESTFFFWVLDGDSADYDTTMVILLLLHEMALGPKAPLPNTHTPRAPLAHLLLLPSQCSLAHSSSRKKGHLFVIHLQGRDMCLLIIFIKIPDLPAAALIKWQC